MPAYYLKQLVVASVAANNFVALARGHGSMPFTIAKADVARGIQFTPFVVGAAHMTNNAAVNVIGGIFNDPKTPASLSGQAWDLAQGATFDRERVLIMKAADVGQSGASAYWVQVDDIVDETNVAYAQNDVSFTFGLRGHLNFKSNAYTRMIAGLRGTTVGVTSAVQAELEAGELLVLERAWDVAFGGKNHRLSPTYWGHMDTHRMGMAFPFFTPGPGKTFYKAHTLNPNAVL